MSEKEASMSSQSKRTSIIGPGHARLPMFISCASLAVLAAEIHARDTRRNLSEKVALVNDAEFRASCEKIASLNVASARKCYEEHGFAMAEDGAMIFIASDPEKLDQGKFFGALFFYALAIAQGSFKADDEGVMNVQLELLSKQTEIAGSLYGYFNEHFSKAIAQP